MNFKPFALAVLLLLAGCSTGATGGTGGTGTAATCTSYDQQQAALTSQMDSLTQQILTGKAQIDSIRAQMAKYANDNSQAGVTAYNALVDQGQAVQTAANNLIAQHNAASDQYNTLVSKHNAECR